MRHRVVVNDEEQYSIWACDEPLPPGWHDCGVTGTIEECLSHIDEVWTDMRPLSLRRQMAEWAATVAATLPPPTVGDGTAVGDAVGPDAAQGTDAIPPVVSRLSEGDQEVVVLVDEGSGADGLAASLRRGYLRVRFTGTQGGTELTVPVAAQSVDAPVDAPVGAIPDGQIRVSGDLTLDGCRVRCEVVIDVPALAGRGRLRRIDPVR